MTVGIKVIGGEKQDVLFPSEELVYGNLVRVDKKTLSLMKAIGIKFDDEMDDATGVYWGTIDVSAVRLVDLSRLLSFGRRSHPIYLRDEAGMLVGFWQNGFWFDDWNAEIGRCGLYLEGVMMTPVPIHLA
jgi:hypothetical protein